MIIGKVKAIAVAAAGAVVTILIFMLRIAGLKSQRDQAKREAIEQDKRADTAEARIEQRQKADDASQKAKEEGDAHVQEAVDRARAGKRDHFSK